MAVAATLAVLAAAAWLVLRQPPREVASTRVQLPPPNDSASPAIAASADFVGAERCATCHAAAYAAWRGSTHGRAGGTPGNVALIAPFDGTPIQFRDARVLPTTAGEYAFIVRQDGRPDRVFRVDGVVGGGHMNGGGTQSFVSRFPDGTWRLLPFDWSRQSATWFCNTASRLGKGWVPITRTLALADCGDWPPQRILGDEPRFSNCQGCHGSQVAVRLDTVARRWSTHLASLTITCESCHGPARRHVELMTAHENRRVVGASQPDRVTDVGLRSLGSLDKDQSLSVCFQCHALKSQVAMPPGSGATDAIAYSLRLAQLGDEPLLPDGRTRTFAYQEGHLSSACYRNGGMTCTSCHDPHSQGYRDTFGTPLASRFDDRQCTACHASKAADPSRHTRHAPASAGSRCTSCHMPYRQETEIGSAIPYARADHSISIPRPSFDASEGLTSACRACHADQSEAALDALVRTWYGTVAPLDPAVDGLVRSRAATTRVAAARLLLVTGSRHRAAVFAALARFVEHWLRPDMPALEPEVVSRLQALGKHGDDDVRATALAALHFARGEDADTRRFLASALKGFSPAENARLRGRWSIVLGFLADSLLAHEEPTAAAAVYRKALEITPRAPRLHLNVGLAEARAGDLAGAIASYQHSLALDPAQPLALVNLGIALESSGDVAGAERAYRRAIALDAHEPLAYFNLGNIYLKRGDVTAAIPQYEQATSLDPTLATGHFYLADAYARTGATRRALDAVERGLEFDPTNAAARRAERTLREALAGRR